MKDKVLLLSHLGLGDHVICNGMVMELLNKYREVYLPVYHHNVDSVCLMFSGVDVNIIAVSSDDEAEDLVSLYGIHDWDVIRTGNFGKGFLSDTDNFSLSFYEQSGIDFECSWSSFYLSRDLAAESQLYHKFGAPMRYIFVHDDKSRELLINEDLVREDLPVIRPDKSLSKTIFEYINILEMAEEIHCMDSSFAALVDRIDLIQNKRIILHRYVRPEQGSAETFYKKDWEIINER